jgi:hypothetical protein
MRRGMESNARLGVVLVRAEVHRLLQTEFKSTLFRLFFPLFFDHLNIIYQYTLENVEPFLASLSAISTAAFIRLRNHIVNLLRHVTLHDDLVNSSCIFGNRPACRKSLSE